jgi:hypothetical protein
VPHVHLVKVLEGSRPAAPVSRRLNWHMEIHDTDRTNSTTSSGRIRAHTRIRTASLSFSYLHVASILRAYMGLQHVDAHPIVISFFLLHVYTGKTHIFPHVFLCVFFLFYYVLDGTH